VVRVWLIVDWPPITYMHESPLAFTATTSPMAGYVLAAVAAVLYSQTI
jgi:hypothetical protein